MSEPIEPKTTTNQNEESKPRYEPPKLILLNEITLGQGVCNPGSSDAQVCLSGNAPVLAGCTAGASAVAGCSGGSSFSPP